MIYKNAQVKLGNAQGYTFSGQNLNAAVDAFGFYKVEHYIIWPGPVLEFTGYLDPDYTLGLNLFDQSKIPINYTVNEPCISFRYSLDGAANQTIQGNHSLPLPSYGSHWIEIFIKDRANHTTSSGRIYFMFGDSSPPDCTIHGPLNQVYPARSGIPLQLSFGEPTSWVGYSKNGSANVTFSGNTTFSVPSDGFYTITIYANDSFGNMGSVQGFFSVDSIAPVIQILHPTPSQGIDSHTFNLNVSVFDAHFDSVWYNLNGSGNVTFSGNTSITAPADGWWVINVYANDTVGHNSGASSVLVLVDVIAPLIDIISPGNHSTFMISNVPFQVEVFDVNLNTTWYSLDGGTRVLFPTNTSINVGEGPHAIIFYANDYASNFNSTGTLFFTVDTVDPVLSIISPIMNGNYSAISVNLNVTVIEANFDSTWYSVNGSANVTFSGNASITMPGNGHWQIRVWANDTFGRTSAVRSVTILVDTIGPVVTILSPANSSQFTVSLVPFSVEVTELHLAAIWYRIDGGTTVAYPSNGSIAFGDGSRAIEFFARDACNNVGSSGILTITIDTTAPALSILSPLPNGNYSSVNVNLSFSVVEMHPDSFWYNINGSANVIIGGNAIITIPGEGRWLINLYANDTFGWIGSSSVQFNIGLALPSISILDDFNNTRIDMNLDVQVNVTCTYDYVTWFIINSQESLKTFFSGNTTVVPFNLLNTGTNTIIFWVNDVFGHNASTGTYSIEKITSGRAINANVSRVLYYSNWYLMIEFWSNVSGILQVFEAPIDSTTVHLAPGERVFIGPVQIDFIPDNSDNVINVTLDFGIPRNENSYRIGKFQPSSSSYLILNSTYVNGHLIVVLHELSVFSVIYTEPDNTMLIIILSGAGAGVVLVIAIGVRHRKKAKNMKTQLDSLPKTKFG